MRAACTACLVIALALGQLTLAMGAQLTLAMGAQLTLPPIALAEDAGISPSVTVRWERPPEGTLQRGALGVPAWVVVASGTVVVLGSALALGLAARRGRRGARR